MEKSQKLSRQQVVGDVASMFRRLSPLHHNNAIETYEAIKSSFKQVDERTDEYRVWDKQRIDYCDKKIRELNSPEGGAARKPRYKDGRDGGDRRWKRM